jgi:hypothetical protein
LDTSSGLIKNLDKDEFFIAGLAYKIFHVMFDKYVVYGLQLAISGYVVINL